MSHPDKQANQQCDNIDEKKDDVYDDFVRIKEAYEHLIKEGGIGKQKNPKFDELKLLEDHKRMNNTDNMQETGDDSSDDLFLARLTAVISDYGDDGFPVSLIARRWNQIWPERPFRYEIFRGINNVKFSLTN